MKILWLGWKELYPAVRVVEAARARGMALEVCEIFDVEFRTDGAVVGIFVNGREATAEYDALIVRTFHPYISEALTVARWFAESGNVVIDQSLTDEGYALSKMHDQLVLARTGLPVPRSWQIYDPQGMARVADTLGYPLILKGIHGSHGRMVHLVENEAELHRRAWHYPVGELMVQEFLPGEEDFRVLVIGYEALPVMIRRKPAAGDFRTNFQRGGDFQGCSLADFPAFGPLAERAARALRREFAAVDLRMRGDEPVILEVNRRPDFQGFEQGTGFDVASRLLDYIETTVRSAKSKVQSQCVTQ